MTSIVSVMYTSVISIFHACFSSVISENRKHSLCERVLINRKVLVSLRENVRGCVDVIREQLPYELNDTVINESQISSKILTMSGK